MKLYLVCQYDMDEPTTHSISKAVTKLEPGQWRLFIAIRGVCDKNIRQANEHLLRCNNIDSVDCKCHEVE